MTTPANRAPEAEARKLLSRLKLANKLPVDVEAAAQALDIVVKFEPFDEDLSGVLIKEPNRTVIGVNSSHAMTRQRFTIAHELGHFVLKHNGEVFVDKTLRSETTVIRRDGKSSLGVHAEEMEANGFAAELLMPAELVVEMVGKRLARRAKLNSEELVAELATTFLVSPQAMEYRLANLGYLIPN